MVEAASAAAKHDTRAKQVHFRDNNNNLLPLGLPPPHSSTAAARDKPRRSTPVYRTH
jgi:hypothetical protein